MVVRFQKSNATEKMGYHWPSQCVSLRTRSCMYESVTSTNLTESFIQPDINPLPALLIVITLAGQKTVEEGWTTGISPGRKPLHTPVNSSFLAKILLHRLPPSSPIRLLTITSSVQTPKPFSLFPHYFFSVLPAPRLPINGGALGCLTQAAWLRDPLARAGVHSNAYSNKGNIIHSMQTMRREKKSFGTYAISKPLERSLHERRDHLHIQLARKREAFQHMTPWRPSRLLLLVSIKPQAPYQM